MRKHSHALNCMYLSSPFIKVHSTLASKHYFGFHCCSKINVTVEMQTCTITHMGERDTSSCCCRSTAATSRRRPKTTRSGVTALMTNRAAALNYCARGNPDSQAASRPQLSCARAEYTPPEPIHAVLPAHCSQCAAQGVRLHTRAHAHMGSTHINRPYYCLHSHSHRIRCRS